MDENTYFDFFDLGVFDGNAENVKKEFENKQIQEVYDTGYGSGTQNRKIREEYFEKYVTLFTCKE